MGQDQLVTTVLNRISEREGVDPIDLPPLYEEIDPDALELLFQDPPRHLQVSFNYLGYRIIIDGDDTIAVTVSHEEMAESSTYPILEDSNRP